MPSGLYPLHISRNPLLRLLRSSGQAAVEFTLTFLILLIVAWIPADFGLAFYTGQLAQNAAREGARIAAADPTLVSGTVSCVMPSLRRISSRKRQPGFRRRSFRLLPSPWI
jgi:Flp pilus assembly protein TadG